MVFCSACTTVKNARDDDEQVVYFCQHSTPAQLAECKYAICAEAMRNAGCSDEAIDGALEQLGQTN